MSSIALYKKEGTDYIVYAHESTGGLADKRLQKDGFFCFAKAHGYNVGVISKHTNTILYTTYLKLVRERRLEEPRKNCACNKQIVWFFDKPTIVACIKCEITFYHKVQQCPYCGSDVRYFTEDPVGE